MAGRGAGGDLVAAARFAHRGAHRGQSPTIRAMPPLPGNGASIRRGRCSCSCKIRRFGSIPLVFSIFVAAQFPLGRAAARRIIWAWDPIRRHRRRGACRRAAQALPQRSRQQGPGLRCRPVALVASSQLFLRMVGWLAYPVIAIVAATIPGAGRAAGAGLHVLDPGACLRHSAAGGADAALARRALPRLSGAHQPFFPLPPHKRQRST